MSTDKTLADVQPGGRVRLGDALLPCPFCGNDAEFVPYKNNGLTLKCKSMGCIQRHQRTLRYGIDWLRTSMTEHWNTRALSSQPSPGGQDAHEMADALVGYACTNCDRTDEVVICQTCAGMAWDNGRLHEFHEVRELSTSLGEGVLDHLLPDEWHEKPLLRFQGAYDEGDDSVGISPRSANVLADDQTGTVLGDYLATRAAKAGGQ